MTQRRANDHLHPEYWSQRDHDRFEDRIAEQIHELREEVHLLATRMAWLLGAIAVLVFLIGLLSPFLRDFLQLPAQ